MLWSSWVQATSWSWLGWLGWIFTGIYFTTILTTVLVVIFDKRDPTKTMLWVVVLVLLPLIGWLLYICFGQNLRRRQSSKRQTGLDSFQFLEEVREYAIPVSAASCDSDFSNNRYLAQLLLSNCSAPVLRGNDVGLYHIGARAFGKIEEDLRNAREYIHMEYYIFRQDELGNMIAHILRKKASDGVDVRVIYDSVGSWRLSQSFIHSMRDAGVKVFPFQRVTFPYLGSRMNNRNHRKILVIDGRVAYMGGMNIADKYIKGTQLGVWIDTQMRIVGPAISALHHIFLTDWRYVTKAKHLGRFTPVRWDLERGGVLVQVSASGPDSHWSAIMQSFFVAITKARRYVYIATPYFVPNESLLTALKTASLSGLDVRILLPSRSDSKLVLWATRSYIHALLEAGIRVFLFKGGFNHSKILMVDGLLSAVGSANMDIRSFEDNFEVMAYIYDAATTRLLEQEYLENIRTSELIDLERWRVRPLSHRIKDSFARLLSPLF